MYFCCAVALLLFPACAWLFELVQVIRQPGRNKCSLNNFWQCFFVCSLACYLIISAYSSYLAAEVKGVFNIDKLKSLCQVLKLCCLHLLHSSCIVRKVVGAQLSCIISNATKFLCIVSMFISVMLTVEIYSLTMTARNICLLTPTARTSTRKQPTVFCIGEWRASLKQFNLI
jgi:hypothetical protein